MSKKIDNDELRQIVQKIRETVDPRQLFTPDEIVTKGRLVTYVCPVCNSGTGKNKTGMAYKQGQNVLLCANCNKPYDAIDIYMHKYGATFGQAVHELAKENNLHQKESNNRISLLSAKKEPKPVLDFTDYYKRCMAQLGDDRDTRGRDYLRSRGISLETAFYFHVGFDPSADTANTKRFFAPRLIVPSCKGHYVARRVDGITDCEKLNPKDSTVGLTHLWEMDKPGTPVFLTEGVFDAMSIHEAGGRAMSLNSATLAGRFLEYVKEHRPQALILLALDTDGAGKDKTAELAKGLAEQKIPYRIVKLCKVGKDPNEELMQNRQEFIKAVKLAMEPIKEKSQAETMAANLYSGLLEAIKDGRYLARKTGIKEFDALLGGGPIPGQVVLLGAQAGYGKTAICQWIAEHMAEHNRGFRALFFSLEMSANQLLARSLARLMYEKDIANLSTFEILQGKDIAAIEKGLSTHSSLIGEKVLYNPGQPGVLSYPYEINTLLDATRKQASQNNGKIDLIVCDYIQLVKAGGRDEAEDIKTAMKTLGDLAKETNAICLCTMANSRAANKQAAKGESSMDVGRGSSNLEYGADTLLTITDHAPHSDLSVMTLEKCRLALKKQSITFKFDGRHMRLDQLTSPAIQESTKESKANDDITSIPARVDQEAINNL